eukprot:CAMPEP_0170542108 /NCGR_PEP_ID=MMETSP0211-20121228/1639_1 /TAXON_ID=311385 /ORGANISM="Pseudokeronopsis sp., Strain OXSARD2" /LENGTH=73 /DNA_ID=CAMNT_0010845063 /DNA_START=800 /DNA_END=1021 /DNA_ORIENTATION=+
MYLRKQAITSRIYDVIDIITVMIQLVDPFVESVLWMISGYNKAFYEYGAQFQDALKVLFNFIYRFGSLFDGTS